MFWFGFLDETSTSEDQISATPCLVSRSGKSVNVMSGDKKSPSAGPSAGAKAKNQQEIVAKFQQLRENQRNIATKITELDQDIKEHE